MNIRLYEAPELPRHLPRLVDYVKGRGAAPLSRHPGWLQVLAEGLGHTPYCLEAEQGGQTRGLLPLASVESLLFGRYLVSLPYLNSGGVLAEDTQTAHLLVEHAVALADRLKVRHLELRHEQPLDHPALGEQLTSKVHLRRPLPATAATLWQTLRDKVRNQVRKARRAGLTVAWGGTDLLPAFYAVFSRNMRDLGTPVYGRALFHSILRRFPDRAELCIVRLGRQPVAAAVLLHGWGVSEVPSASSLREHKGTCANMLLYWQLLVRALERGQAVFDFGRSTIGSSTDRFKRQWGAEPAPAVWQYYVRAGAATALRPEHPRYRRLIQLWQRLPVGLTRLLGPAIVRGIP